MLLVAVLGWLDREQCVVIAYLREENRVLCWREARAA
jgi:hypothetical protein